MVWATGEGEEPRGTGPGGGWYGILAGVAVATVVVTGLVGVGRATDLRRQVDGFEHLDGGGGTVSIVEPGDYAVYHEWVERGGGNPYATGTPAAEPEITVFAPDGTTVPVRPSGISYGWGSEQAEAVGTFAVTEPGQYRIEAAGTEGRLAFGEKIAGGPFYGFGAALLLAGLIVAGCAVAAVVVARRRRDRDRGSRAGEPAEGRMSESRGRWGVVAVGAVAVLVIGGAVAYVGLDRDDPTGGAVRAGGPPAGSVGDGGQPPTSLECVSDADYATGLCGLDPAVLREMNLDYADRLDFTGDIDAAGAVADQVRAALAPLAATPAPGPTPDQVRAALAPVGTDVEVSDIAVRTAGTAFGIAVDGGCVFGSVHDGTVDVEVGGYVDDGGCLAEYGH
jgi:hypothetical protein